MARWIRDRGYGTLNLHTPRLLVRAWESTGEVFVFLSAMWLSAFCEVALRGVGGDSGDGGGCGCGGGAIACVCAC